MATLVIRVSCPTLISQAVQNRSQQAMLDYSHTSSPLHVINQ